MPSDRGCDFGDAHQDAPKEVAEVARTIEEQADDDSDMSVGDMLDAVGTRSYGPLLLVLGLLAAGPTGVIPGMAVVTATLIVVLAGQLLFGLRHPWLPRQLLRFRMPGRRVRQAAQAIARAARPVDALTEPRMTLLCDPPFAAIPALVFIAMAGLFYPLAFVPFGVLMPGAAVVLLALALTARDGLLLVVGLAAAAAAAAGSAYLLF